MNYTKIVELCTYTDISFRLQLFYLPGLLACRLGLAATGVMPIQVQAHKFN